MVSRPILLVEDNEDDEELGLMALRSLSPSVPVEVARDGKEALAWLFDERTDGSAPVLPLLILLDLKLPKIDGFQILRRVRADPRTKLVPVVVLSSSDAREDVQQAYELGANSFVCKPLEYSRYRQMMDRVAGYWLLTVTIGD